jgi:hypothetical protein
MKYRRERLFLKVLLPAYKRELLTFNLWNEREKEVVRLVFLEKRSIDNIIMNGLMKGERTTLFNIKKNALLKLKNWIKTTQKTEYKLIYKNLIC